ncbi:MAG: hypothetical protein ETSY2_12040 [Candidatus Entotheonella gemina]|uniref:Uncharacterized protein n=2 Tax=Candidatus Entotheonella TaxID=93171 RepID=W4MCG2_9BACT|nr:MAG: hypothetical protein ETSY2_12040 [Candidatus Entotheonella gemina]
MSETPPTLSMAEQARTLVYQCSMGSLSTLSAKHPDWPFGSVIPYGLDAQGQPTFLISAMAMHTQNLQRDARASLLVTSDGDHAPLATARLTLMGTVAPVPGEVLEQVRSTYVLRHPEAAMWAEFSDFAFYGMAITDTYYVGGFGVMGWVTAQDYMRAEVDPLVDIAASVATHMNEDHAESLVLLARHAGGLPAQEATLTAVDHLGFDLRVVANGESDHLRIGFPQPARDAQAVRSILTDMVR